MDINKERPMSIKRAAKFMDVSERTINRWFSQGLERVKIGGKVYTSRAALDRFKTPPTPDEVKRQRPQGKSAVEMTESEQAANAQLEALGF